MILAKQQIVLLVCHIPIHSIVASIIQPCIHVGAIALRGHWTEHALDTFLFSLNCSGSEDSVWECAHGSVNDGYTCDGTQDAAVICSGELKRILFMFAIT